MNKNHIVTIAVAKGYLWKESQALLEKIGFEFNEDNDSRKLFTYDKTGTLRILKIRPWDVSVYVEQGAADLGIVGKDVLIETDPNIIELLDLKLGYCELVLAGLEKQSIDELGHNITVATKYWNATTQYFRNRGLKINPIKLYGAVELAPTTGVADIISDLTATGATLKENNLNIIETVFTSTARLVANKVSINTCHSQINDIYQRLQAVL